MASAASGRRGTRLLAPPSRHPAVGRAQPTPAAASRRGGLGRGSTAETYPLRAVGACGRGSRLSSKGKQRDKARPITSAHVVGLVDARASATAGSRATTSAIIHTASKTAPIARARGGQAPPTPQAGAPCSPPACDRATTLPRAAGSVWLVVGSTVAALRARRRFAASSITLNSPIVNHDVAIVADARRGDVVDVRAGGEAHAEDQAAGDPVGPIVGIDEASASPSAWAPHTADELPQIVPRGGEEEGVGMLQATVNAAMSAASKPRAAGCPLGGRRGWFGVPRSRATRAAPPDHPSSSTTAFHTTTAPDDTSRRFPESESRHQLNEALGAGTE